MRYIGWLALILIALLGFSFAVLNAKPVPFEYYFGSKEIPLSILLVAVFALGIFIGWLAILPTFIKLRLDNRRLRRQLGR